MNFFLLKSPIVLIPMCLLIYFLWKRFFIKDSDRKIISELIVIGILLSFTNYIWAFKIDPAMEPFRLRGNF